MRREGYLGIGIGVLCLLAVVTLLVAPGAVATQESEDPSRVWIQEVTIEPGAITGNAATLRLGAAIGHRGGPGENVSVTVRAIDGESGLVADETTTVVEEITGDREQRVTANVTVQRQGGYDLVTILYVDGQRVDTKRGSVSGVEGLSPTSIAFKRFETGTPTIDYTVEAVDAGQATLSVRTRLWNEGVEPAQGATVEVVARQSDSNVIADRTTITVDRLDSGQSIAPAAELTVPDGYGYQLDAILKHEGVIVSSATSVADLDPDQTIEAETTVESVPFETEDFTEAPDEPDSGPERPSTTVSGPGFGPLSALIALVGVTLVGRLYGGRQ